MKKITFLLAFMLLATMTVKATQWTVSNDPNTPAQYSNLQTAIDNAAAGDTILIYPSFVNGTSPTSYGSVNINIPLVLIGGGGWFENGSGTNSNEKKQTFIDNISLRRSNASLSASGTKLLGLRITYLYFISGYSGSTFSNGGINEVLVENCSINYLYFNPFSNYPYVHNHAENHSDTIRNCVIWNFIHFWNNDHFSYCQQRFKNIFIVNNIFSGAYIQATHDNSSGTYFNDLDSVYVRNNVFINKTTEVFNKVPHLLVENNIFYGADPGVTNTPSGVIFNKNICYSTTSIMPGTGNLGTGNLNNTNPNFVNFPSQGGAFDCSYDFSLQSSSPAKNAGLDGTDIGLTGGLFPFYNYCAGPMVPVIKYITLPANANAAPLGGTLNVTFKAKKQE